MLKDTKRFYNRTKLRKIDKETSGDIPITHVKVFHKNYPRLPSIPLENVIENSQLDELITTRESSREFLGLPLSFRSFSKILSSCRIVDSKREPERRTYPSAGARFPIELYPIVFNIDTLEKGVYHYDLIGNRLELLLRKDLREVEEEIVSPYVENPAAAIVMTSVISRSEVKYGFKAYPYSLIEAGHMGQNILLFSEKENVGACPVGGFINDSLTKLIDPVGDEIPIYVIALGVKNEKNRNPNK